MKNILVILFFITAAFVSTAQKASSPIEFSKNTISIGVVVSDLERSLDFYINVIGMQKTGEFSVSAEFAKQSGLTDGIPFDVTILKLEDNDQANEWKLMSFRSKTNHPKQNYINDDTGIQYITIFVKSMKPILERIKKHNVKILSADGLTIGDGRQFVLVQDPDGTIVEIIGWE